MPARVLSAFLLTFSLLAAACVAAQEASAPSPGEDERRGPLPFAVAAQVRLPTRPPEECTLPRPDEAPTPSPQGEVRLQPPAEVPTPQPYDSLPLVEDEALAKTVLDVLEGEEDAYAVVVKELRTGRGFALNADRVFYAASLFKLFIMYELFHQEAAGFLQWADELVMTPYYDSFGMSQRATTLCETLTVARAAWAMMSVSDNAAAVLLQDLVGSGNVNRSLAALGLKDSHVSEEMPATAADVALLLEAIGRGAAVDAAASEQMVALMEQETLDNGLRAGLPAGVAVAHKTGNWAGATHDAGIVLAPRGAYVIVVLSDSKEGATRIRRLSQAVYDYFQSGS